MRFMSLVAFSTTFSSLVWIVALRFQNAAMTEAQFLIEHWPLYACAILSAVAWWVICSACGSSDV